MALLFESIACGGFLECTPSRTTLAHDGARQEIEGLAGSEGWWCCCRRDSDPMASLPSTPRGGEAAWWGEVCCQLALPDDRSAPSARGEGLPSPPLGVGREVAGSMAGGASPVSAGGAGELGPHTSRVRQRFDFSTNFSSKDVSVLTACRKKYYLFGQFS